MKPQDKAIRWNKEKSALLKETRGIGFETIESLLENGDVLDIIMHPTLPHQKMFLFDIDDYVVTVPFVESDTEIFLKTLFHNRKINKQYKRQPK